MAPSGHTKKALLGDVYVRYTIDKNVVNTHNVMQNLKLTKQKKYRRNPQKTTQTSLKEKLITLIESSFDKDNKETLFCVVVFVQCKSHVKF